MLTVTEVPPSDVTLSRNKSFLESYRMNDTHAYQVTANWEAGRNGNVSATGIQPAIPFSTPPEFQGIDGLWTPEHFLVAAVASCFVVTFYGVAAASKLEFSSLHVDMEGKLGKPEGKLRFTEIILRPILVVPPAADPERAKRILEKAKGNCLIALSLFCPVFMEPQVRSVEAILATE